MIYIEEIVDELVDLVDSKLNEKGIDLATDETDELRECMQMVLEAREGL